MTAPRLHDRASVLLCLWWAATAVGCQEGEADPPRPDAADSATEEAPFIATGHEPEWRLEVTAREMTLVTDLGETRLVVPTPEVQGSETDRRFVARSDDGAVIVSIVDELCSDSMTGMPYPVRVTVETAGGVMRGCGGRPDDLHAPAGRSVVARR